MKLSNYLKSETLWCFVFFALVATGLVAPIASETFIPNLADYITHLGGIIQAKMALAEGQFPLRVAPFEETGFRYPYFQFYSSTCYTFAALIYQWLTPDNPLVAFKITVWFALLLGGFYIYRLAYDLVKSRPAAILAGLAYLTTPYYIIVVNHLGSLTESLALGVFPVALFYTLRFFYHPKKVKLFLQTSLAWYLLITIHIVTFVYASLFTGLFLFVIVCKQREYGVNLLSVSLSYLMACLLAMWYLAPLLMLNKFFLLSNTVSNAEQFIHYSPLLSDLLFPAAGITPGSKSAFITIHPGIGWSMLFAVGICAYAFFNKLKITRARANLLLPLLLLMFLLATFMAWSPFNFWHYLPRILLVGQYSWRLLGQVIWIGSLLFAWALCCLFKDKLDLRHTILGSLILLMIANPWFPQTEPYATSLTDFLKKPTLLMAKTTYLLNLNAYPKWVNSTTSLKLNPSEIIDFTKMKNHCRQEGTKTLCHLTIPANIQLVELPILYYPYLLNITLNGVLIPYQSILDQNKLLVSIRPVAGDVNDITIEFTGLAWANDVSWIVWGLWIFIFILVSFQIFIIRKR